MLLRYTNRPLTHFRSSSRCFGTSRLQLSAALAKNHEGIRDRCHRVLWGSGGQAPPGRRAPCWYVAPHYAHVHTVNLPLLSCDRTWLSDAVIVQTRYQHLGLCRSIAQCLETACLQLVLSDQRQAQND